MLIIDNIALASYGSQHLTGWIDSPVMGQELNDYDFNITGWVAGNDHPIRDIIAFESVNVLNCTQVKLERPDALDAFKWIPAGTKPGFTLYVNTLNCPAEFKIRLVLTCDNGEWLEFASISGHIQATAAPDFGKPDAPVTSSAADNRPNIGDTRSLYLTLVKHCLLGLIYDDPDRIVDTDHWKTLGDMRNEGYDWPAVGHSMIGFKRLNNVQFCVEDVLAKKVPGDFIETGVWRGGTTILMRAVLAAHNITDRTVWVADSFAGLPPPTPEKYPADKDMVLHLQPKLSISRAEVEANFKRYGLLDSQVHFLQGWFSQTLPIAPIDKLAVLRLDGDLYESTMDALISLYPKLSPGGYIIVDDYGALDVCRKAVEDYRAQNHIVDEIQKIDWTGIYWQRS